MTNATIYVVDDDCNVRRSLITMLRASDYETEDFASGASFLADYCGHRGGCILMDIVMPDINGLDVLDELTEMPRWNPIIMMTGQADVPMATRAGGVRLPSSRNHFDVTSLIRRIQTAVEYDSKIRKQYDRKTDLVQHFGPLTRRELEVLDLVVTGKLTKQIAYQLGISQRTVETHRGNIMTKVGADRWHLVALTVEVRTAQRRERSFPTRIPTSAWRVPLRFLFASEPAAALRECDGHQP